MIEERFELARIRLKGIKEEKSVGTTFLDYFKRVASFIEEINSFYEKVCDGYLRTAALGQLQKSNHDLYADVLPDAYKISYANPVYAVKMLGEEYGAMLSFLYMEIRAMIPLSHEKRLEEIVIRMELFLEIYQSFICAFEENQSTPIYNEIKEIIYWWISDYSEFAMDKRIVEQLNPEYDFAAKIITRNDLSDLRYLYRFGEYITDSEIETARHINALPEEKIKLIADTYTEGYRIGFVMGNKDLSKKKTVNIRYRLGFERVIRRAIDNFKKMGLEPTIYRAGTSIFWKRGNLKIGYYGAIANKQCDYDHREDEALFLDKKLISRKIEILTQCYEKEKEWAAVHAGPACVEIFGEIPFTPDNKKESCRLSEKQQKWAVEYMSASGQIVNQYIKGEERSFTIIAFPSPQIGAKYEEIFDEVIKINTLDYTKYQKVQQTIINALDKACQVRIIGENGNHTDLIVQLRTLADEIKETKFENCVADVNIPVGEVFTSPVLKDTTGTIFVKKVYLNELKYVDLEIQLKDGMVTGYSCSNFESKKDNDTYIKENVLFHHETLPIGEFAIGTNTTAYVVAGKYGIEDKLPILIAEKMGPHFALGDTCYSHAEDVKVYNLDGKEIVARDNEVSILRKTQPEKAYFNCHTDITIPYEELGELYGVTKTGEKISIIEHGRFVLPGCDLLNEPFSI